jgi:hypothetical protein
MVLPEMVNTFIDSKENPNNTGSYLELTTTCQ